MEKISMPTSRAAFLSKPVSGQKILPETFAYMNARARRRAYNLVMKEFKKSGITKAELARRLGKGADRVSKMLAGPGNWTIATVSELLFAICGAEPKWDLDFPLDKVKRNDTRPAWLEESPLLKVASIVPNANAAAPQIIGTPPITSSLRPKLLDYGAQLASEQ
jgi:hypothetical protein